MRRPAVLSSIVLGPVVPMALAAQVPGQLPDEITPGWLMAFMLGVWVLHSIMDAAGKLPWSRDPQIPSLKVDKIHDIVSREDAEKPGYYMVWSSTAERRQFERQLRDHEKLVGATIETLEALKRSLASLHQKVDRLEDRGSA
jgi:hypothetical protein